MSFATESIPYVKQRDNHTCGAAALAMVYQALGQPATQEEIWPDIHRKDSWGRLGARTYLLCQDALRRGLAGLIIQAREPRWELLRQCHRHGLKAILNHQLRAGAARRHFSVLLDVDDDHVRIHDPFAGPNLDHERQAFLRLWEPTSGNGAGYILVALANARTPRPKPCSVCGSRLPARVSCLKCKQGFALEPAVALGCVDPACKSATWDRIYCPHCDAAIFFLGGPDAEPLLEPAREEPMSFSQDFDTFSQQFTKYQDSMASAAAAAPPGESRELLQKLMDQMREAHGTLADEIRKQGAQIEERQKKAVAKMEQSKQKAAEAKAKRDELLKQRQQKKAPPPSEIDPHLSQKLSQQLLAEFGNRPEPGPCMDGDVWDWVAGKPPQKPESKGR